jgi:hypothetical protein
MNKKIHVLIGVLALNAFSAFAATPSQIQVGCIGHVGNTKILNNLQFGDGTGDIRDLSVVDGITYSIQVGSYQGQADMILLMNVKDSGGVIIGNLSSWIRAHGASELEYSNGPKNSLIYCTMSH